MKKLFIKLLIILFVVYSIPINYAKATNLAIKLKGNILLQVESHGEAWYVNPADGKRYYMKDGPTAYQMMRNFGLGITNIDLAKLPQEGEKNNYPSFVNKLKGKILLQIETHGEAWYVNPKTGYRHYMKNGDEAYNLMRFYSLGISNKDLDKIVIGKLTNKLADDNIDSTDIGLIEKNDTLDSDSDGIKDAWDFHPLGGSDFETKTYNISMINGSDISKYAIKLDIPYDRYNMYVKYYGHTFTKDYSNFLSFVTPEDSVIKNLVSQIQLINIDDPAYFYRLVGQIFYISDYTSSGLNEYPKYPAQTLYDGYGDCEDSAFLLASILKKIGKDVALLRYSNHAAVAVAMTDSEIKSFNNFITAMNNLYEQMMILETKNGITEPRPASVQWVMDGWDLYHTLQYYEYGGKKYVYLESTASNSIWLSIGQIPQVYKNETPYIYLVN